MRIPLANLFTKSPLPRIVDQMECVVECADKIPELMETFIRGDQNGVIALAKEISILEGKCDDAKNEVRARLPVRLILPVDRRDVLRLISQIDSVADCAEDVGVLLTLRQLQVPRELVTPVRDFTAAVLAAVHSAARLVATMEPLMAGSFSGKQAATAHEMIRDVANKEHAADKQQDRCAKILFSVEDQLSPVAVFMWTKVLNKLGDMANHSENIGDQFRLFIAR